MSGRGRVSKAQLKKQAAARAAAGPSEPVVAASSSASSSSSPASSSEPIVITEEVVAASSSPAEAESSSSSSLAAILEEANGQRTVSGILTSQALSRDIKFEQFSLSCYGRELITPTNLELNYGRRYGLVGANGSGKTTMMKALAARELAIPPHIDIYFLQEGVPPSEQTAMEAVLEQARQEVERLEAQAEDLSVQPDVDPSVLEDIYDQLDALDATKFEARATSILLGLGFTTTTIKKKTKDMSGGWRMRVALARALFVKPMFLLLDEPTNHLDMEACVWLENYLQSYNRILLLVSHSQDFLNNVCTNIMHLSNRNLTYYAGNYDRFIETKTENETNQSKAYYKQQEEIAHIKQFIASCGTYANLVRQGKSRQKILDRMQAEGLIQLPFKETVFTFRFESSGHLPPPVLSFNDVSFSYSGAKTGPDVLYKHLDFGIDMDSRIALVGPNGVGKSTLLKLITAEISATDGRIARHPHLRLGRYHQHSVDQLDLSATPVEYLKRKFPHFEMDLDQWRRKLGQFGISGPQQMQPIQRLSDGQRSRVVFAEMACSEPNMLLLDEPTNPLDIECIDSLAAALNAFDGGVLLVSHDFRLISQVAQEIWVCENQTITKWEGDIQSYKSYISSRTLRK